MGQGALAHYTHDNTKIQDVRCRTKQSTHTTVPFVAPVGRRSSAATLDELDDAPAQGYTHTNHTNTLTSSSASAACAASRTYTYVAPSRYTHTLAHRLHSTRYTDCSSEDKRRDEHSQVIVSTDLRGRTHTCSFGMFRMSRCTT